MRSRVEGALRVTAWLALGALALLALRPTARPVARLSDGVPMLRILAAWAMVPPAESVVVRFTGLPNRNVRDRLSALRSVGMAVGWTDNGVAPLAAEVELDQGTGQGVIRSVGGAVELADAAGPLGVVDGALIVSGVAPPVVGAVTPSVELVPARDVVVLGIPSWETRWVARGLEASGWMVHAVTQMAPGLAMPAVLLDTAEVGVVVVLDSVDAATTHRVTAFVRSGGGLVLGPGALASSGLAALAPATLGPEQRPTTSLALPDARTALAFRPVVRLRDDAVVLDSARIAARTEGRGRVLLVGETETWRLAMASDAGQIAQAAFWSRVAEAARYRPVGDRLGGDPAPRASLVATFGPPVGVPGPSLPTLPWEAIGFGVALVTLLGEWTSRRLRGAA